MLGGANSTAPTAPPPGRSASGANPENDTAKETTDVTEKLQESENNAGEEWADDGWDNDEDWGDMNVSFSVFNTSNHDCCNI